MVEQRTENPCVVGSIPTLAILVSREGTRGYENGGHHAMAAVCAFSPEIRLDTAVAILLSEICHAEDSCARLAVLIERWGFRLPMASAILTVLYPDQFTIYDVRVCDILGDFHDAQNKTKYNKLWERYVAFIAAVREAVPSESLLRDKDRFLWGQSFASQLQRDVSAAFSTLTREP